MNQQVPLILYHDFIESVVAALEAKDAYSANHSRRVSDMVEKTCIELGLPEDQTELIHMAAHAHDIGKIGVPDSILTKRDKLTPEEWKLMQKHPQIGADILNKSHVLSGIAEIVLHHHERWDGKGYPSGLQKTDIPYGSRIIAVCDSIDAMMSRRSYREKLTAQECRLEIQRNINVMYDPDIARAILNSWDVIVTPIHFN